MLDLRVFVEGDIWVYEYSNPKMGPDSEIEFSSFNQFDVNSLGF